MNKFDSSMPLPTKLKKNIILTISSITCKSYGPESLMTLMCTSTGRVLTTNNGIVILETLHLSHPLAKVIVQALKKQYKHTADGIKTFLLYLSQSVIELERIETITGKYGDHLGNKISLQLRKIERDLLPILYNELYSVSVRKTDVTLRDLKSILNTNISSHMSRRDTSTLVDLLLQSVGARPTGEVSLVGVQRNVQFMVENFGLLHFKLPRSLLENSKSIEGFLIRRDFSYRYPHLEEIRNCKFVLLQCSIEGITVEDPSEVVYLKDENTVSKSLMCRINATRTYIKQLKDHQVSVIICSERVPDFVLTLCRESELSVVSCVEEEDVEFLERVSSVQAVSSPLDPIETKNIGVLSSCKRKVLGSQRNVHIQFPESVQSKIPEMLILSSPTEGSVDQLADVTFKALKSLEMCFAFQPATDSTTLNDRKTTNNHAKVDDDQCIDDDANKNGKLNAKGKCPGEENSLSSESPVFVAVGGGGFFEMKTAELLKTYSQDFTDDQTGLVCKILYDALYSIPRTLHKQLSRNRTSESRDYLEKLQQLTRSMKEGDVCGFDRRGRVCDVIQTGILEPLASKISTLASVIQLLQQILRIDSIVSVAHLPEQNDTSDDDTDD